MNNVYRRVVVTGMGAVTPVGNSVKESWSSLVEGKNGIGPITLFDTEAFKAKLGAQVKDFDPLEYMERQDMLRSDRYTHFAVAAASQAVTDSGIEGKVAPEKFAVYFGTGIGGIGTFETEHSKLLEKGPRRVSPLFVPMMIANIAAGTIAIRYNCKGAAMPSVTACASGSNAIGEALRAIRHGYADAVIAGGAEAAISPSAVAGFVNMQALSVSTDPDAASLPFDKRRGGFVIGEGSAAFILEEYEHAVSRGAHIYAEVCGYGSTCDAYHITAPHPEAEGGARAMIEAMEEAGYTESDRVYVNAHGTATIQGDLAETWATEQVFKRQVPISSTKSYTGHTLGACGAIEGILSVEMMNRGWFHPTLNLTEIDIECGKLDYIQGQGREIKTDYIMSNNFAFGGINTSLIFKRI